MCSEEALWIWQVYVLGGPALTYRFRAGQSCAGEPLTRYGAPELETVFNDLKPAHTLALFTYLET